MALSHLLSRIVTQSEVLPTTRPVLLKASLMILGIKEVIPVLLEFADMATATALFPWSPALGLQLRETTHFGVNLESVRLIIPIAKFSLLSPVIILLPPTLIKSLLGRQTLLVFVESARQILGHPLPPTSELVPGDRVRTKPLGTLSLHIPLLTCTPPVALASLATGLSDILLAGLLDETTLVSTGINDTFDKEALLALVGTLEEGLVAELLESDLLVEEKLSLVLATKLRSLELPTQPHLHGVSVPLVLLIDTLTMPGKWLRASGAPTIFAATSIIMVIIVVMVLLSNFPR